MAWLGGSTGAVQLSLSLPAGSWDGGRKVANSRVACCRSLGIRCSPRSTPDAPIRRPSRGRHGSGYLSCPRAPAGGPLAELLGMSAGQVGRGPAAPERVAPAAERAERSTAERVRRVGAPAASRQAAAFRPACALALAHKVASGTDLVVRTRAVPMACGAWRAVAATARRPRATVEFRMPIVPSARSRSACRMYGDTLVPV